MTIAAGFLCQDGIVICADREVTTDWEKHEESKIFTINPDGATSGPTVVIAGSGWLDFVKMTVDKIRERTLFVTHAYEVKEILEATLLEVHEKHIRFYPDRPKPSFDLIVGIRDEKGLMLLKTFRTSVNRIEEFTCIGVGDTLANYLSRKLNPQEDTAVEAALLAVQILDQVKTNVPGCGGQFSEVAVLPTEGKVIKINPVGLLDLEYRAKAFALLLKPLLMAVSNPTLSDKDFEERIAELADESRQIRKESNERMRRAQSNRKKPWAVSPSARSSNSLSLVVGLATGLGSSAISSSTVQT
jgi:20S proteasome alpha/beta subunit